MIEIGQTLREARRRQHLQLADVERATKLRERYLRALEEERFDLLPQGSYRRTFLRGYARFLGLDDDLLVGEFVARYEPAAEAEASAGGDESRLTWQRRPRVPGRASAVLVLLIVIGVVVWRLGGSSPTRHVTTNAAPAPAPTTTRAPHHRHPPRAAVRKPALARIIFDASSGDCWLDVHRGSASGPIVYQSVLVQGQTVTVRGSRFWARIGAPAALSVTIDGKPAALPAQTGNVTLDARGIHPMT